MTGLDQVRCSAAAFRRGRLEHGVASLGIALTPTDQIRLNSAAGHLQLGDALDAWHELEMIEPQNRAQTEVLVVRLAVCRALKDWELAAKGRTPA